MTKEEYIRHLCDVVNAVFRAEEAVSGKWLPILQSTKDATKEERSRIAQEYVHAIAEEMIEGYIRNGHTIEELTNL